MIGLIAFAAGLVVGALKQQQRLAGATVGAAAFWVLLFGPLDGELAGGLTFLIAVVLLGIPLAAAFAEGEEGSPWERFDGDGIARFAFVGLGVLVMIGLTAGIAIGYAEAGTIGGVIVMGLWVALLARTFVPIAWEARPRR